MQKEETFSYQDEQFADLQMLRYRVDGFEKLTTAQKTLIYYLSEAALAGRDILWDQNGKYNLRIRKTLETIYTDYPGDRNDEEFKAFTVYLKRVWFASGIHHHYALDKFRPEFSVDFFTSCVKGLSPDKLPLREGQSVERFLEEISPVIFDSKVMPKRSAQSGDGDLIKASSNNYYGGDISQKEVEDYYAKLKIGQDTIRPISYGLNSRLVKEDGQIKEKVWKVGGLYSSAIERIVERLRMAIPFAENDAHKAERLGRGDRRLHAEGAQSAHKMLRPFDRL